MCFLTYAKLHKIHFSLAHKCYAKIEEYANSNYVSSIYIQDSLHANSQFEYKQVNAKPAIS